MRKIIWPFALALVWMAATPSGLFAKEPQVYDRIEWKLEGNEKIQILQGGGYAHAFYKVCLTEGESIYLSKFRKFDFNSKNNKPTLLVKGRCIHFIGHQLWIQNSSSGAGAAGYCVLLGITPNR